MNKLRNAFIVAGLLLCLGYTSNGQELIIRARPPIPHYVRVAPPSPRHVWIDEEWEPRSGTYVFVGGHWAMPPHPGWHWMPGHWDQRPRGEVWVPGHWRR